MPGTDPSPTNGLHAHHETIRQLYLVENKTREEVRCILSKHPYNLETTEWEFEKILNDMNLRKNIKKKDWQAIAYHVEKRKQNGLASEVFLGPLRVKRRKLQHEISRYRSTSTSAPAAKSPRLSEGVIIRTPSPSSQQSRAILPPVHAASVMNAINTTDNSILASPFDTNPSAFGTALEDLPFSNNPEAFDDSVLPNIDFEIEYSDALPLSCFHMPDDTTTNAFHYFPPEEAEEFIALSQGDWNLGLGNGSNVDSVVSWSSRPLILLDKLPWFQFQTTFTSDPFVDQILQSTLLPFDTSLSHHRSPLRDHQTFISNLLPTGPSGEETEIMSKLASLLQAIVPERFDGEVLERYNELTCPSQKCDPDKIMEVTLCLLSNNVLALDGADQLLEWITKHTPVDLFKRIFRLKSHTTRAIAAKLLDIAVERGYWSILQFLLDAGIEISLLAGAERGRLLRKALIHANPKIAMVLIENGADVNPPDADMGPNQCLPLCTAVRYGYTEIVRKLLDNGAAPNRCCCRKQCGTPLEKSIIHDRLDCARLLLEAGAKAENTYVNGTSLLDFCFLDDRTALYNLLQSWTSSPDFSVRGILLSARKGVKGLENYLERKKEIGLSCPQWLLEQAMREGFQFSRHRSAAVTLLEYGVDPNIKDYGGTSLLEIAMEQDDLELAILLLDNGADILSTGVVTAAAALDSRLDFLHLFISECKDLDLLGSDALVTAIENGNFAGVKLLIRSGVSLNVRNSEGRYPIQEACWRGNMHMVEYLVEEKADIHAQPSSKEGFTALHFAVEGGHINIVKFLLQNGANVDGQSHGSRGRTLLEACTHRELLEKANFSREEMFKILIEAGSPIDGPPVRRCRQWNSALIGLILGSANDELIELAFNAGADVNSPGSGKGARSPIQAAAQVGNLRLVKKLLVKGANINAPAAVFHGRTALQAACSQDIPNELVRFLLQNGAEVNAEAGIDGGVTALQGAAIQGHIKIVLLLHDAGADVSAPPAPKNGRTALEGAAEHGRLDTVQILLNAISASGKTWMAGYDRAIKLARNNSHYAVSELLESQSVEQVGR